MTDKKISELDVAFTGNYTDVMPVVQDDETFQISNLAASHDLIGSILNDGTSYTSLVLKIGNAIGRVGISEFTFWSEGVQMTAPDQAYIMLPESGGGFGEYGTLANLVNDPLVLVDGNTSTFIKYDAFITDGDPRPDTFYLYFGWGAGVNYIDEVRIRAASGGAFDADETPEFIAFYPNAQLPFEYIVGSTDYSTPAPISWTSGQTKTFNIPNMWLPKHISVGGGFWSEEQSVSSAFVWSELSHSNLILASGDIIVRPYRNTVIDRVRNMVFLTSTSFTINESYVMEEASDTGIASVFIINTNGGDRTVTISPPTAYLTLHGINYDGAKLTFINDGSNDLIIANSGFGSLVCKGTPSTPAGGHLTVIIAGNKLYVGGDTT